MTHATATETRLHAAIDELDATVAKLRDVLAATPDVASDPTLAAQMRQMLGELATVAGIADGEITPR